jgi:uncharacterized membrane protein YeaQ/YmgE (transglycosylase-associated protein family)
MSLIAWIIVGALAGWIASIVMKTDASMGLFSNIIVGMIGSVVGGAIVALLTGGGDFVNTAFTQLNLTSLLVSVVGAIVTLGLLKALRH